MRVSILLCVFLAATLCAATPSFARRGANVRKSCWTCTTVVAAARTMQVSEDDVDRVLDNVCDHVFPWLKEQVRAKKKTTKEERKKKPLLFARLPELLVLHRS
jgi:hypothetical protein